MNGMFCVSAWLNDVEDPVLARISRRTAAMSNLTLDTVEDLQVYIEIYALIASSYIVFCVFNILYVIYFKLLIALTCAIVGFADHCNYRLLDVTLTCDTLMTDAGQADYVYSILLLPCLSASASTDLWRYINILLLLLLLLCYWYRR